MITTEASKSAATLWCERIQAAKLHWENDYLRARRCMEFAAGMQWNEQTDLESSKYIANMTLRMVSSKVANLYAKNPEAEAKRKPRLDFAIWDEKLESLQLAVEQLQSGQMNPAAQLVVTDYLNGRNFRNLVDRIGKTMEILYDLQLDLQDADFKQSMKQLVRRVIIAGVGFVRINYERNYLPTVGDQTVANRLRKLSALEVEQQEGNFSDESAKLIEQSQLAESVMHDIAAETEVAERLVFDFPSVTSIIVDPRCTQFKNFIGAEWIAQEYQMTVDDVNAFFELRGEAKVKASSNLNDVRLDTEFNAQNQPARVKLWEVFDKRTKSAFFVVENHTDFIQPPQHVEPEVKGFWPINAITFNDLEVENRNSTNMRVTCWPPSDVWLWLHPQKEWNRRRNGLARHRMGASPKIGVPAGVLDKDDKAALRGVDPDDGVSVIEFKGLQPNQDLSKLLQVIEHPVISSDLYDTGMLQLDMMQSVGEQGADLGTQGKGETATGQTIAAQSKSTNAASNVDDIDDLLSWMAKTGGQILLSQMPQEMVQELVGPGAVWPQGNAHKFNTVLYLDIKAASSGRPNKALHLANVRELFPILMQLGANPAFMVREGLKAYDEQLNADEAFPLLPPDLGRPQAGIDQRAGMIAQPEAPNPASAVPGANAQPAPQNLPIGAIPVPTAVS